MSSEKIPIYIPRYVEPSRVDCECRRKQLDLEFKFLNLHWKKDLGSTVAEGEIIGEGEVEKVFFEILAPADGTLSEICIQDGAKCDIHRPIAYVSAK